MFRNSRMYVEWRFTPRLRNMGIRTLPHDYLFHPLESQRVAVLEMVFGGHAGRNLQDVFGLGVRRVTRTRIGLAWRDVVGDVRDVEAFVDPDHVQRDEGVFHPEGILAGLREEEDHPAVVGQVV